MKLIKILVCGGRDYTDVHKLEEVMLNYWTLYNIEFFVMGGAKGANKLAEEWCIKYNIPHIVFEADWSKYGKQAGVIRNIQMLKDTKPNMVIAFPGGKGTAHMIKIAKEANVEVIEIEN